MSTKALDVLVFIPLIPAVPVLATWFLPWEEWLPKKIPKYILGPYLLYCTFGAWYFGLDRWAVALFGLFAVGVCIVAYFETREGSDEET